MRDMKDSGVAWIGEIPSSWGLETIKQLMIERNEKNREGQTDVILSLSAKDGVTLYDGEHHAGNRPREDLSDYKVVHSGDIVVNSMNILSGSVGLSQYNGCVSPVYYIYYPRGNGNQEYFHYVFQSRQFQLSLWGLGNGILIKESGNGNFNTIRMRIPAQKLGTQMFPVPPRKQQDAIVKTLNSQIIRVDTLIFNVQTQIEKLKAYKQSLITEAVTKGLDHTVPMADSKVTWIGRVPQHWLVARIKNAIIPLVKPIMVGDDVITCFRDGTVTLRKNRREDGFTVSFTEHGYQGVDVGDLVIHGMDAFAGAIGCSDSRGKTTPVVHVCKTVGNNRYFMYFLRSMAYGNILMDLSNGVRIRSSDFRNFARLGIFEVLIPPIEEQDKMVEYLDEQCDKIDHLISNKQQKIEKLNQYKKSLIYEYVTGKKEVE